MKAFLIAYIVFGVFTALCNLVILGLSAYPRTEKISALEDALSVISPIAFSLWAYLLLPPTR